MIEVYIVDDSAVARGMYTRILEAEADIKVTATGANGEQAIKIVKVRAPDVMILDLNMPVMDGLAALPHLLSLAPGLKILIASALSSHDADISLKCLQSGASDFLAKPTTAGATALGPGGNSDFKNELVRKVRELGGASQKKRHGKINGPILVKGSAQSPNSSQVVKSTNNFVLRRPGTQRAEILAIGSSTGGPQALFKVLQGLGKGFPLPIVITQHMPATFTPILASHITSQVGIPCTEGRDGDLLSAGKIYLAPGNFHMTIQGTPRRATIKLNSNPPENFCRPAVDPMFRSVSEVYAGATLAVILTGMGSDGCRGGEKVVAAGGTVIAQDEETSVVWGMPGAVAKAGICAAVLPLEKIGPWLSAKAKGLPI